MSGLKNQVNGFKIANNDFVPAFGRAANLDTLSYFLCNGCTWRALPSEFGPWEAVYQYFNRLSNDGYFEYLQDQMIIGDTSEAIFIDSTLCKVHQHSNGPGTPEEQAIGKSRGGLNMIIHMVVDVLGRLAAPVQITPGNTSDIAVAPGLLETLEDVAAVGDKEYDSGSCGTLSAPRTADRASPRAKTSKIPKLMTWSFTARVMLWKMCSSA